MYEVEEMSRRNPASLESLSPQLRNEVCDPDIVPVEGNLVGSLMVSGW